MRVCRRALPYRLSSGLVVIGLMLCNASEESADSSYSTPFSGAYQFLCDPDGAAQVLFAYLYFSINLIFRRLS
jgi:hypothetical protein